MAKPDFDAKQEEYNQLIEQRKLLIDSITNFTKAFHTAVFSVVGTLLVAIPIVIGLSDEKSQALAVFLIIELGLGALFFIMMLLFTTSNDRDYIRAIDQYIKEKYDVKTLFYQGEMSYRHINKTDSSFSIQTLFAGLIVAVAALTAIISFRAVIWVFFMRYLLYCLIVLVTAAGILAVIARNFVYKSSGKSNYYNDCIAYLRAGKYSDPPERRKPRQRKKKPRRKEPPCPPV